MQKVDEAESDAKNKGNSKETKSLTEQVSKLQEEVQAAEK